VASSALVVLVRFNWQHVLSFRASRPYALVGYIHRSPDIELKGSNLPWNLLKLRGWNALGNIYVVGVTHFG
jgi:hypothetical protein